MKDEGHHWWIGNNGRCDISGKPCENVSGCGACDVRINRYTYPIPDLKERLSDAPRSEEQAVSGGASDTTEG